MNQHFVGVSLTSVLCMLSAAPVCAQATAADDAARSGEVQRQPPGMRVPSIQVLEGGRVAVRAQSTRLGELLRALQSIHPFQLRLDANSEARPVTLTLEAIDVRFALYRVLMESGVAFVASGLENADSRPIRVVAGESRAARNLSPAAARDASPVGGTASADTAYSDSSAAADFLKQRLADEMSAARAEMAIRETTEEGAAPEDLLRTLVPGTGLQGTSSPGPSASDGGLLELPFPAKDGGPLFVPDRGPTPTMMLPFTDRHGLAIEVAAPPPGPRQVMLPFTRSNGAPIIVMPGGGAPASGKKTP